MLINCQNCQKIVSSFREICPHCAKMSVIKNNFFGRFGKIFSKKSKQSLNKNVQTVEKNIKKKSRF